MEVETKVIARGEIGQPVVADADPPPLYLVYYGVHHRVGKTQPLQVCPSAVRPGDSDGNADAVQFRGQVGSSQAR